ncbi:unnamed protein product [Phyllotreta striolata]|uniref:Ionotropic receptor 75a N-terminal domain-containing protein n=1 Tax=Phyllotreta striolata TaxID=444603 RepID=A0A9N9TJQ7_PHYSR|nr:unnamed protein product [Phyllotreta striolata]
MKLLLYWIWIVGSSSKKFRSIYHWLLLCSNSTYCKDVSQEILSLNIRLDTDVKLAIFEENSCEIFEIYNAGIGVTPKIQFLGEFSNKTLKFIDNKTFYESRKSLEDVLIRTGSGYKLSFETDADIARERRTRGYRTFDKFNYQLFLCLKSIHKFQYNTTYRNAYFGNTTEGIDAGVAQLLYEETVDMSVSGGFIRDVRIDYYDFLVPVYKFRIRPRPDLLRNQIHLYKYRNPNSKMYQYQLLPVFDQSNLFKSSKMYKIFVFVFAILATAFAAPRAEPQPLPQPQPQPQLVAAYSAPGVVSAYSAYPAGVAYSSPYVYSGYSPVAYTAYV